MSFFQKLCPSPFSPASVLVFFWVHGCSAVSCDFVFMRRGGCPYTPPSCLHSLHFEFVFIDVSFPFLPLSSSLEIWWLSLVLYLDYFFFLVYLLEIFVLWLLWYFCIGVTIYLCLVSVAYLSLFWLFWVFVALSRLSLETRGATLRCGMRASHRSGFSCCRARAVGCKGFSSCSTRAW